MTRIGRKPPGLGLITSGATAETKARYAEMLNLCGTPHWLTEVAERYDDESDTPDSPAVPPTGRKSVAEFYGLTGRYPASCQYEYVDPLQPAGADGVTGAVMHETMRQDMIAFARMGGRIGIQDHFGSPAVSNLAVRMDNSSLTGWSSTNYIPQVLSGGAKEADLLAYLDRLAVFFNGLVNPDTGAKIPVAYRPMHEANSRSFWWAGETRQADYITLWRKIVDYLRTTKGVTNVIYVWALNAYKGSSADPNGYTLNSSYAYSTWYPGDTYVDVVGLDYYNDGPITASDQFFITGSGVMASFVAAQAIAGTACKPVTLAELGFQQAAGVKSDIWEAVGKQMQSALAFCYGAGFWRPPWGPKAGDSNTASLVRMTESPYCLTLDKL